MSEQWLVILASFFKRNQRRIKLQSARRKVEDSNEVAENRCSRQRVKKLHDVDLIEID